MKKTLLLSVVMTAFAVMGYAQNYMVVNTQKVFQSMPEYVAATAELDTLAAQYQRNIDAAYKQVGEMYDKYQQDKEYLGDAARSEREDAIIDSEKKIAAYQEEVFGQDGTLMQKRVSVLKPIQDKVFEAINKYAESNGYQLVLDSSANPSLLYYSPAADKTEQITNNLK